MWILPNSTSSAYAPGTEDSILVSREAFPETCHTSLTVNEKHMRLASFSRALKRDACLARLSGQTLRPFLSADFETWLISQFSEGSPANRSAPVESVPSTKANPTPDTSGLTSDAESGSAVPRSSFWKTWTRSQVPSFTGNPKRVFSGMSFKSWKAWVTTQRRLRSAREKAVDSLIIEGGGSSSPFWPSRLLTLTELFGKKVKLVFFHFCANLVKPKIYFV